MYFVTYVDRVNVSTAAVGFKQDLGLTNTDLGLVFSAFGYPYLVCQIIGGWFSDRFGARWTLTVCGLIWASATIMTGLADGLVSLMAARLMLGLGEGATFPTATRAMASWRQIRLGAGHHPCQRPAGQRHHATAGRSPDRNRVLAGIVLRDRRDQPAVGRRLGLLFPRRSAPA
jgi:hypothetical protein